MKEERKKEKWRENKEQKKRERNEQVKRKGRASGNLADQIAMIINTINDYQYCYGSRLATEKVDIIYEKMKSKTQLLPRSTIFEYSGGLSNEKSIQRKIRPYNARWFNDFPKC
ncbi:hypothetical protein RCL_jg1361.t1 [Rhizophagus clarus]|uniref:Uncharacterized protein n=1 Tax=Rhizophagus clarus TaxID=94130 RepID=A0A8H3R4V5_9GLOM|nr:hypothetical protein RCL_jg1361.t1 [Rhizophagus clarus]